MINIELWCDEDVYGKNDNSVSKVILKLLHNQFKGFWQRNDAIPFVQWEVLNIAV